MKKLLSLTVLLSSLALAPMSSQAVELNLLSVNLGSPESQKAQQMYGNAYGYTPQEVAPALLAPPEETPAILQIAKAAGTAPLGIWMMRKLGYSYPQIVSSYAIPPATLYGSATPLGTLNPQHASPRWYSTLDPMFIELSRVYFLRRVLGVDPVFIGRIPYRGADFSRFIIEPYHPVHGYWLPPGQAKKIYGGWVPPGQAKKMHGWGPGSSGVIYFDSGKSHGHGAKIKVKEAHGGKGHGGHGKGKGRF